MRFFRFPVIRSDKKVIGEIIMSGTDYADAISRAQSFISDQRKHYPESYLAQGKIDLNQTADELLDFQGVYIPKDGVIYSKIED